MLETTEEPLLAGGSMGASRMQGKVALVTGASRGIGSAVALAFASERGDVIVNYLRSEAQAEEVVARIVQMGQQAIAVRADVSCEDEVQKMVSQALERFGRIDILVNNAGILLPFRFEDPDYDGWHRMVEVNIKGVLLCSRAVAEPMRRAGSGKIINITVRETRGSLDYVMTKAADDVLTRGLARELAPHIRVNAIAPGFIDTGYISAMPPQERDALSDRIPLKRWGEPEDVARVALFLASDDANWMTGTTILVDGGEALTS
jgi:3-oxoacyl-[acyl-carrier protein] reductase